MLDQYSSQYPYVFKEIIIDNQYQVTEEDLKDKNIIDVGGNVGYFTLLSNYYKANQIVTIESNIEAYNLLLSNVNGLSDKDKITIINKAAFSESNKKVSFYRPSPAYKSNDKFYRYYMKHVYNIDGRWSICKEYPGIIDTIDLHDILEYFKNDKQIILKVDIEGSEYDFIYGAKTTDLIKCSTILIEMHENIDSNFGQIGMIDKLKKYLENLGYVEKWNTIVVPDKVIMFRYEWIDRNANCN